jgi:hypothetical protein
MIRHVSAVAIALCLNGVTLSAQTMEPQSSELTVRIASATVHKSPSVGSPVIGKAQRGTVLPIRRNLGSWVEVPWSESENGVAFLHVNSGSIAHHGAPYPNPLAAPAPAASASAPLLAPSAGAQPAATVVEPGSRRQMYISVPSHIFGVGGRMNGSMAGFGVTARRWWGNLGLQLDVSRSMLSRVDGPGELRSTQFAPSVLYSLPDGVSNVLWVRPYVGGGAGIYRATVGPALATSIAENQLGFQTFGGGEVTFSGAPQFSLSGDIAYRWARTPLAGFEPDKIGYSLSGHWYVK